MIDLALNYLSTSTPITIFVLGILSVYFILIVWIFTYRYLELSSSIATEKSSYNLIKTRGVSLSPHSMLSKSLKDLDITKENLKACETSILQEQSSGLSWLSIISSTAPFVGLFGTVVGILESFAKFTNETKVGFSVIAPAISEALVATAAGIFVAIFAYTFHQILTRMLFDLNSYIEAESQILTSRK
jgi:biopolymer transport protein ExbB